MTEFGGFQVLKHLEFRSLGEEDGLVSAAVPGSVSVRSRDGVGLERDMLFTTGRRRVFDAVVHVGQWWPHRVHHQARVVIEARVGGRFFEDWGDGCGVLYGQLEVMAPPSRLCIRGPLGLAGPLQIVWSMLFSEPEPHQTLLHATHHFVGVPERTLREDVIRGLDEMYLALNGYLQR